MRRIALALAALTAGTAAMAATITVLVQETAIRKRAQAYAPAVGTARLGQKFESQGEESGFHKTASGWIHASAVTVKKVKLGSAGSTGGSATADEVTLAGKGFNAQVEKSYGAQNASANFKGVDAMERRSVTEAALMEFLKSGSLLGGAK